MELRTCFISRLSKGALSLQVNLLDTILGLISKRHEPWIGVAIVQVRDLCLILIASYYWAFEHVQCMHVKHVKKNRVE